MGEKDQQQNDRRPWDRREGETPAAWRAFACYRDMGPGRSLSQVSAALYPSKKGKGKKGGGAIPAHVGAWSSGHEWVARCAAYDAWCDEQVQEAFVAERLERNREHARLGAAVMEAAAARLLELLPDLDERGASAVVRAFTDGAKLERAARSLEGEITQHRLADSEGGKLPEPPVPASPTAQIASHLKTLLALKDAGLLGGGDGG